MKAYLCEDFSSPFIQYRIETCLYVRDTLKHMVTKCKGAFILAPRHKDVRGSGGMVPRVSSLDIR